MLQPMEHLLELPMCLYNILLTSNYSQSIMMIRSDLMVVLDCRSAFCGFVTPIESLFQGLFGLCLSVVMTQLEYSAKTTSNPAISQILEPKVNANDGCCLKTVKSQG